MYTTGILLTLTQASFNLTPPKRRREEGKGKTNKQKRQNKQTRKQNKQTNHKKYSVVAKHMYSGILPGYSVKST